VLTGLVDNGIIHLDDVDLRNEKVGLDVMDFVMDNVRVQTDEKRNTFAIQTPEHMPGVLRTGSALDNSNSVGVITPGNDTLLYGLHAHDFMAASSFPAPLLYWTGDLRDTSPALLEAASFWPAFNVFDDLGVEDVDDSVHVPMIWMSHPNVAAQPHYDRSHNLFVQLSGRKEITLLSPSMGRYIHPFPAVHASKKQSQIPFNDDLAEVEERFPNATRLAGYSVALNPGEVLYIPPFWYHSITTGEDASMSLSVVSPSWEEAHLSRGMYTALPLGSLTAKVEKMMAAQMVLIHLLSRTASLGGPKVFSEFVYDSRWKNLEGASAEAECFAEGETEEVAAIMEAWSSTDLLERLEAGAAEVAKVANDDLVLHGVKMNFVADYMEQLSSWAVGPDNAGAFMRDCLGYDSLEITEEWDGQGIMEGMEGDPNRLSENDPIKKDEL
jgi:hypothetical protein